MARHPHHRPQKQAREEPDANEKGVYGVRGLRLLSGNLPDPLGVVRIQEADPISPTQLPKVPQHLTRHRLNSSRSTKHRRKRIHAPN